MVAAALTPSPGSAETDVDKEVVMTFSVASPVVVGVDGSVGGSAAAEWAAREARRHKAPLRLVHGFDLQPVSYVMSGYPAREVQLSTPLHHARVMLTETAGDLRRRYPDLDIGTVFSISSPAGLLTEQSRTASMVVVGARGRGGFAGLLAGSVGTQVAAHAYGPVIVVRGNDSATGGRPVVVGVDGSPEGAAALGFALEAAAERSALLIAVHVWPALPMSGPDHVAPWRYDSAAAEAAETVMLDQLAGWQDKYPDVTIEPRAVYGFNPGHVLVAASQQADLVVVGCRGRGGFAGTLLGSVSRTLVHHAASSVAVIHSGHASMDPL
jgi:nucleotide-binding universal stress UspA family protein